MLGKVRRTLAERIRLLRRIYWHPLAAAAGVVYVAISALSTLSGEFASPHLQKAVRLGNLIPHLSGWIWTTIGLALLLLLGAEGSYREFRRVSDAHHKELTDQQAEQQRQLQALRQSHDQEMAALRHAGVEDQPEPLQPQYGDAVRYRHLIGNMTEHRIGLRNPAGNPAATGVRLEWTEMKPRPAVQNVHWERWLPAIPSAVPRVAGGDPAIGISLSPGQEEVWAAVTTATTPDGIMNAVEFGPEHGSSRGNWHGLLWNLGSGGQWRLSYRIVTDNLPPRTFSLVITAEEGKIECALEG